MSLAFPSPLASGPGCSLGWAGLWTDCTLPQVPVHAGGGDLRGKLSNLGVRLHHAARRGGPAGAPARYVPQQVLQDLRLAFLAELRPPALWKRGCEWLQWRNAGGLSWGLEGPGPFLGPTIPFDPCHPDPDLSVSRSYSQCSRCSQRPHLQPHHGRGQQQRLESGFWRC